eukprot:3687292-Lingulodinium_polyedra.AAC.1
MARHSSSIQTAMVRHSDSKQTAFKQRAARRSACLSISLWAAFLKLCSKICSNARCCVVLAR